jgi:hypothetical protein
MMSAAFAEVKSLAVWPRARALPAGPNSSATQNSAEFKDLSGQSQRALQALPHRAVFRAAG